MLALLLGATGAGAQQVSNLTGLPSYPNINSAFMDGVVRTDALGRWCAHFSASTGDPLERVESWYRKALLKASETNLEHDSTYAKYVSLNGIKLNLGVDYVAVYKISSQAPTTIDLYRCAPVK